MRWLDFLPKIRPYGKRLSGAKYVCRQLGINRNERATVYRYHRGGVNSFV